MFALAQQRCARVCNPDPLGTPANRGHGCDHFSDPRFERESPRTPGCVESCGGMYLVAGTAVLCATLLRQRWTFLQGEELIPCTRRARLRADAWSRADYSATRSCLENRFEEQSSLESPPRTKRAWTSRRCVRGRVGVSSFPLIAGVAGKISVGKTGCVVARNNFHIIIIPHQV